MTDEMTVQAILLVEKLRVHRIACLYQNDVFGLTALNGITAALSHVGIQLAVVASYASGSTDVASALETIAGNPQPVQAVVMASLETQGVKFLRLFRQDNRTDPDCVFLFTSGGVTSAFASQLEQQYWTNLYFTHVVPPLDTPGLSIVQKFQKAAALYMPSNLTVDQLVFEGYLDGLLIVQVLQGIPGEITRRSFLNELYNTRLFVFGGLLAGLYSRNFSGCENIVCSSSIGLRSIFPATLNMTTGAMHYDSSLGYYTYSVTELSYPVTGMARPLLFGQLLPTDDAVWQRVAETIGEALQDAFALLNASGGVNGRPVQLIQQWYSGDPAPHAAALAGRFSLLAFVGSVVNRSESLKGAAAAQIGTYQTDPLATYAAFNVTEVEVQASQPLEITALVSFALQLGLPVYLRAPATAAGQAALQVMVKSLHSLQQQPTSSLTYVSPAEALQGLSSGAVIAIGSDADIRAMFLALADLPQLRLLTTSPRVVHLLGSLNVPTYSQATRFHYPYMFNTDSLPVISGPEVQDATLYGQLLGSVLTVVLAKTANASLAYTTTSQVLNTWYGSQYTYDGVTLGPFYSTACSATNTNCECNEGVRTVAVLTATRQQLPVVFTYALSTCHVVYADLIIAAAQGPWYIGVAVGTVGGVILFGVLGWWLSCRGRRDNATAPKDPDEPFCILFTDIQSSTNLWANIPDVMANALHVHHELIRRLILKHKLYEVKTIGDSFMCATRSPAKAVEFALHLQRELFEYDWGTKAIDTAYFLQQHDEKGMWSGSHAGWNGLRVRIGIHFGHGDITLDPVSHGYDYYGTVVNTAARIESVCHGGQIGVSQEVHDATSGRVSHSVWTDLGSQPLRGLAEPVRLFEVLPAGVLSQRRFPPLRLEKAAELDAEEGEDGKGSCAGGTRSAGRSTGVVNFNADFHPLVRKGMVTAAELQQHYNTALLTLITLLATQTPKFTESTLKGFCNRLKVAYVGSAGIKLTQTLHGLVMRVLPATVTTAASADRRSSVASLISTRSMVMRHGPRYQPSPSRDTMLCSPQSQVSPKGVLRARCSSTLESSSSTVMIDVAEAEEPDPPRRKLPAIPSTVCSPSP
eukprot:GGOE01035359.1.p1 GENE.GGOE01035359.1~~GGOE01035359.1.p1  ORF type:complete len:1250 (-),score=442.07 GGOE01035359.1:1200-4472(-)